MTTTMAEKAQDRWRVRYDVTPMRRGGFRAECHAQHCEWYEDHADEAEAEKRLTAHRKRHRNTWRRTPVTAPKTKGKKT